MEDMRSRAGEELDRMLTPRRMPWAWIVIAISACYILAHIAPWAWHGFNV